MSTFVNLDWHDVGSEHGAYAMFDHGGESYTFRVAHGGEEL